MYVLLIIASLYFSLSLGILHGNLVMATHLRFQSQSHRVTFLFVDIVTIGLFCNYLYQVLSTAG